MLQCTDGRIYEATWVDDTRRHGASARGMPRGYGAGAPNKCLAQSSKSRTQGEATNNRNQTGGSEMELTETTIDRLRKRLGRDPTEEEIQAERDRKWRFALADMGITAECFLDEK